MCTTKLSVADGRRGLAVGGLEHARGVDRDVPLRVAQDGEDVGRGCGDGALNFDAVGHSRDGVRTAAASSGISSGFRRQRHL